MEFAKIYDAKINEELKNMKLCNGKCTIGHCFRNVCSSLNRNILERLKTKSRQ